ncbi:MAG: ATP-grasp ribosomal peptide maturase [Chloroflexi bacterium OHK40]|uniref:MvdC/MvdD family ATP grasp protein n=1 Tax=Chloroflexus sp. TaxID=1904827 RepID=UPI002ACD7D14|nr:hypothetical protein [Chloroflexus sp.]
MRKPVVLILTQQMDFHVDPVIQDLNERKIEVHRFDTGDFPENVTITFQALNHESKTLVQNYDRQFWLEEVTSIWYRRPTLFRFPQSMSQAERKFAHGEARAGVGGILRSMDCLWVSHPEKIITAGYKALQLKVALQHGFSIPRTIITNNPEEVVQFYNQCNGNVIFKTLESGFVISPEEGAGSIYTNKVTEKDMEEIERVRLTTNLFQEYIEKKVELRITVIGKKLFTVAIHSQHSHKTRVDWRKSYSDLYYEPYKLPEDIHDKCINITDYFGLNFSAIDMIVTPEGEYVFLELNPNGQWAWLEDFTGLPMKSTLVELLIAT